MFCPACGAELFEDAAYCHKCGREFQLPQAVAVPRAQTELPSRRLSKDELLSALKEKSVNLNKCHSCLAETGLLKLDFGLAMIKTGRNWQETIASVAISAISLPLGGIGLIKLPSKNTEIDVLPLEFHICLDCFEEIGDARKIDFSLHPWFGLLWDYGYNRFITPSEIENYKSK